MPSNKRTVAAIVRALSARKQADLRHPAARARFNFLRRNKWHQALPHSWPADTAAPGFSASGRTSRITIAIAVL